MQNSLLVLAWKCGRGGTTFVASPVELPWLDEQRC